MKTEIVIQKLETLVKLLKEQNMLLKRVFNSRDAALYLGISLDSLYHLTGRSQVPCYKMNGHRLFFSHDELEKWVLSVRKTGKERGSEGVMGRGGEGAKKTERAREPTGPDHAGDRKGHSAGF